MSLDAEGEDWVLEWKTTRRCNAGTKRSGQGDHPRVAQGAVDLPAAKYCVGRSGGSAHHRLKALEHGL